jgi:very-short-patch-repair endonuclease
MIKCNGCGKILSSILDTDEIILDVCTDCFKKEHNVINKNDSDKKINGENIQHNKKCKHCGTTENLCTQYYKDINKLVIRGVCKNCWNKNVQEWRLGGHTKEAREKAKISMIGRKYTEEHCKHISDSLMGRKLSQEHIKAISESHKGIKWAPEVIKQRALSNTGIKHPPRPEGFSEKMRERMIRAMNNPITKIKCRENALNTMLSPRCYQSKLELKMKQLLEKHNIHFIHNKWISDIEHRYPCDFYIPSKHIVIETDGDYWHEYPNGLEIDKIRTQEMINKGYKVLRFWENQINNNIQFVEQQIINNLGE